MGLGRDVAPDDEGSKVLLEGTLRVSEVEGRKGKLRMSIACTKPMEAAGRYTANQSTIGTVNVGVEMMPCVGTRV